MLKRWFALYGVVVVASVVFVVSVAVPAFGGPNAVNSISATKLAKTALKIAKRADKRSKKALKEARPGATGPSGSAGPSGQQGVQGVQGAAGTARAYGLVSASGSLSRSKNVASVSHPFVGVYCMSLAGGIDPATTAAVATVDFDQDSTSLTGTNNDDQAGAEISSSAADCSPGQLEVVTGVQSFTAGSLVGNSASDEGFFFVVP